MFERREGPDFCLALGYNGTRHQRLDLDVSPAAVEDHWHIRLMADGTAVLFEQDVSFKDATDKHPCIIRF